MSATRGTSRFACTIAVVSAVLLACVFVSMTSDPPVEAQTAPALTCSAGSIFNLDVAGNIYSLTLPTAGTPVPVNTHVGNFNNGTTDVNGLGITPSAAAAYAVAQSGAGTVYRFDGATGVPSSFDVTGLSGTTFIMGAVDPGSGIFYYAGISGTGANRFLQILGFNTMTNTGLARSRASRSRTRATARAISPSTLPATCSS
jgi:hypothetical protein